MKYSTIIGLFLVVIGLTLYILQGPIYFSDKEAYISGFLGLGIGLFLGGIMGFLQKRRKKVINHIVSTPEPTSKEKSENNL